MVPLRKGGARVSNGPIEPRADLRGVAHELREMYVALLAESFTPQEALVIVVQIIATNRGGQ